MGQEESQMRTMNQSLADLLKASQITMDTAMKISQDPVELQDILAKGQGGYPNKNRR
jgi:Tfp pilus assembly pilus retraction ATPase PilT